MRGIRGKATGSFLRILFYQFTGFNLASITLGAIKHSAVTRDYILSVILLGMMFFVVGEFFVDPWRSEYGDEGLPS